MDNKNVKSILFYNISPQLLFDLIMNPFLSYDSGGSCAQTSKHFNHLIKQKFNPLHYYLAHSNNNHFILPEHQHILLTPRTLGLWRKSFPNADRVWLGGYDGIIKKSDDFPTGYWEDEYFSILTNSYGARIKELNFYPDSTDCNLHLTNKVFIYLKGVEILDLHGLEENENITTEGLSHLAGSIKYLRLYTISGDSNALIPLASTLKFFSISVCSESFQSGIKDLFEAFGSESNNLLEQLKISSNPYLHSKFFSNLSNLRVLDLHACRYLDDAFLSHLPNLTWLKISVCDSLTDLLFSSPKPDLLLLDMRDSPLTGSFFHYLSSLQILSVSACDSLSGEDKLFGPLVSLRVLEFSSTNIRDQQLQYISSNIQIIKMSWCDQVTNSGMRYLSCKYKPHLWGLDIGHCDQLTPACVNGLDNVKVLITTFSRELNISHMKGLRMLQIVNSHFWTMDIIQQWINQGLRHFHVLKSETDNKNHDMNTVINTVSDCHSKNKPNQLLTCGFLNRNTGSFNIMRFTNIFSAFRRGPRSMQPRPYQNQFDVDITSILID